MSKTVLAAACRLMAACGRPNPRTEAVSPSPAPEGRDPTLPSITPSTGVESERGTFQMDFTDGTGVGADVD